MLVHNIIMHNTFAFRFFYGLIKHFIRFITKLWFFSFLSKKNVYYVHPRLNFIFVFINLNSSRNTKELVSKHYSSIMAYGERINVNCLTIHVLNQMMYSNSFRI